MNWLTKTQTERILRDLQQQGVESPDLAEDLLDHICSAVEREMETGLGFEEAYEKVRTVAFPASELQAVQAQTEALLAGKQLYYPNLGQSFGLLLTWCLASLGIHLLVALQLSTLAPNVFGRPVATQIMLLGVAVLLLSYAGRKFLQQRLVKADLLPLKPLPWVVYPVLTGLVVCVGFWLEPLGRLLPMPPSMQQALLALIHQSDYIPLVVIMFILTVLMEVLFTGVVLNGLLQKYAPATAIFCSSLFFAVSPLNPWAFPAFFVVGLLNGWLFYKSRSWFPVLYTRSIMGLTSMIWVVLTTARTGDLYDFSDLSWRGMLNNDLLYYGIVTGSLLTTMLLLRWLKRNLTSMVLTR